MTLELLFYIILIFMGLVSALIKIPEKFNFFIYFTLLISYSIIVRYAGFDIDMNTYAKTLAFENLYQSNYYLREPAYWLLSNFLYQKIIGVEQVVFILFDTISFVLIYFAHKNFRTPTYFLYLFIVFFPSLMGFQNIYRQYLSMCFLLLAISYSYNGYNRSFIFWLLSGLIHNVGFIFLPVLYVFRKEKRYKYYFYVSSLSIFLLLPMVSGSKSHDATGLNLGVFYIAITFFVLVAVAFVHLQYNDYASTSNYLIFEAYLFLILVINVFILGKSQAERVGMLSLSMSTWVLCKFFSEKFKDSHILSALLFLICVIPTFLFSSAFNMLLTSVSNM